MLSKQQEEKKQKNKTKITPAAKTTIAKVAKKSVHWEENVVSDVLIITRLSKTQICGTPGVDNWSHFANLRIKEEKAEEKAEEDIQWASRTLTQADLN